jgi:hypothetical protein
MEIILEVLALFVQFLGELFLQFILEGLVEVGLRQIDGSIRRPRPFHPALATIGYAMLGASAGGFSLWLVPALLIDSDWLKIVNLIATPTAAGAVMAMLGAWRRRRGQALIRLDRFGYGFVFALAMAIVRFAWGQ